MVTQALVRRSAATRTRIPPFGTRLSPQAHPMRVGHPLGSQQAAGLTMALGSRSDLV
jgi:hypothetical protein